jgi:hypothetical protein
MRSLFEICTPRDDVLRGDVQEADFAADLAKVLRGEAPKVYGDAATFFANTHPTNGLKRLIDNVCRRLGAHGGAPAIFRLDTQYGGGKTHALIALSHVAGGMRGVTHAAEFVDAALLPKAPVRIAAFDGENADPANGRLMEGGIRAFTPWGELAVALAGAEGYRAVEKSDKARRAPGAETLQQLFGNDPTLILVDELAVYLRKVRGLPDAEQLTPFLTDLFKAVESAPRASLVFTLAIGKGGKAVDAYAAENEAIEQWLDEAKSVAARKATLLDPTEPQETPQVLRRRLFAKIEQTGATEAVQAYQQLWIDNAGDLSPERPNESRVEELRRGYPFHPALMSVLTDKLSTLADFQRVRGMLRLLTQAVANLWTERPARTHAIHVHHLNPAFGPTRNEVVTRLQLGRYEPAIRNDVAADASEPKSLAQTLDAKEYAGMPPYGSLVARTILWNTFAFNEDLQGVTAEELRYSILGPGLDAAFVNDARKKFVIDSAYLDDRAGIPLRFLAEANLNQMIRQQETRVDPGDARDQLQDRIRSIFSGKELELVPFAADPSDVPADAGGGRPYLVHLHHDAEAVRGDRLQVPPLVDRIFRTKGQAGDFRQHQNNLVFVLADEGLREAMKHRMARRLALEALRAPERKAQLSAHQQDKVDELFQRSEQELALAIQQCYRHIFFPSRDNRVEGAAIDLAHVAIDVQSASDRPGQGQQQVLRVLGDNNKLRRADDHPLAPSYVRDRTPLKKGSITTADLRAEFRKDPRLPMLLGDENFFALLRKGIDEGLYVYQSGDLVVGKGDPPCTFKIEQQSFVLTTPYAEGQGIWPRKKPEARPPGGGGGEIIIDRPPIPTPPEPPPGVQTFRAEAPLREAITRIAEDARAAGVAKLASLSLRVFEASDAFKLMSGIGAVQNADRRIELVGEYETSEGSAATLTFKGVPGDAGPVREFLQAQFNAASEKDLTVWFYLRFPAGLAIAGEEPAKLVERLARFATGAALVEAVAEAAP